MRARMMEPVKSMELRDYFGDILRSVAFLSRIPMPSGLFEGHQGGLSRTVRGFPAAGVLILLPSAITLWLLLSLDADPLIAAIIALVVQVLATGALHEDGLADSADGLFGGRDREHALAIMKDSHIGSYGTVALILGFGLRAASIAALARDLPPVAAAVILLAVAASSRMLLVWHWTSLPSAREKGVAAGAGAPLKSAFQLAVSTGLLLAGLLLLPFISLSAILASLGIAALACAGFTAVVRRKIGGHTGDTLGATQQICEATALAALATAA